MELSRFFPHFDLKVSHIKNIKHKSKTKKKLNKQKTKSFTLYVKNSCSLLCNFKIILTFKCLYQIPAQKKYAIRQKNKIE